MWSKPTELLHGMRGTDFFNDAVRYTEGGRWTVAQLNVIAMTGIRISNQLS